MATFSCSNDMFGNGVGNGDDFRTAGLGGHLRLGGFVLAVDGAMLTDRDAHTRSDELVAVAGWAWGQENKGTGWHASGFAGAGAYVYGDLHGQDVQNAVHRTINVQEVHLVEDVDGESVRPTVTGSAALGWLGQAGLGLTGWWGGQLLVAGQATLEGETVAEIGPRLVLVGQQGAFWIGPRLRLRDGRPAGPTAAATGVHEDGWWLDSGTFVTPFGEGQTAWGYQVRAAFNPETRAALGSIGVVVRPQGSPTGPELALEHDLALYDSGGMGVQLRWHPWPWQDTGRHSAAVLDYGFGSEPDGALHLAQGPSGTPVEADLRHDQLTLGWEEAVRSPDWSGLRFVPWIQAGAGVRQEGVVIAGTGAKHIESQATTLVGRGAVGVRLVLGELVSIGVSLDGWLPAWSEELRSGRDSAILNDPGVAAGLHLAAHISW